VASIRPANSGKADGGGGINPLLHVFLQGRCQADLGRHDQSGTLSGSVGEQIL
jgi:hypothetical protein